MEVIITRKTINKLDLIFLSLESKRVLEEYKKIPKLALFNKLLELNEKINKVLKK